MSNKVSIIESYTGSVIFIFQHPLVLDEYGHHKVIVRSLNIGDKDVSCIKSELENLIAPKSSFLWQNKIAAEDIYDKIVIDLFYNVEDNAPDSKTDKEDGKLFDEYQKSAIEDIKKVDQQTTEIKSNNMLVSSTTTYSTDLADSIKAIDNSISHISNNISTINKITSHMLDVLNRIEGNE